MTTSFATGCRVIILTLSILSCGVAAAQQAGTATPPWNEREQERAEPVPDPARGERLFKECRKCHATAPGEVKIGPSLAGIVGRRPGSVPAFGYSQDMIDFGASGDSWSEQNLDRFLTRPRAMIGGTKMIFQGFRKPADRADLIAYLTTLRG